MMRFLLCIAVILLFGSGVSVFANPNSAPTQIHVVTTTAHIADIVKNIAADKAKIENLMGSGTDPHLYQPTRSDMAKLLRADMIFFNGLHLEGRMVDTFAQMQSEKTAIAIAENLPANRLDCANADGYQCDPHVWMDVKNWIFAAAIVRDALCARAPQNCEIFTENARHYEETLKTLDADIQTDINAIPAATRVLITAHDAFGYFGRAYGVEVIGIQGISTQSEAGLKRISEIVSLLVERRIPAVFVETSVGDQNIKAIIEGAKAKGHYVKIGGYLYSDAMGEIGTPAESYNGMMRHNSTTISKALRDVVSQ